MKVGVSKLILNANIQYAKARPNLEIVSLQMAVQKKKGHFNDAEGGLRLLQALKFQLGGLGG